ncbi:flagellar hook assembly protein FlgD [Rheinheimera texasensis]|uniref:flagellar hook assembly protein FlgD n=1 Tax=Rheinheimera texasensis TaxID=306205 RepID=UPI00068F4649|nr:flagellar hook assembly protein FlgD [Rheinheimera texasensis]
MTTISNTSGNSYLDSLKGTDTTTKEDSGALTQSDFFALLTQQLAFQDPTKPVENDQMIAQMTSFTMADGISSLNTNFKDFAASMNSNQALQASSLVGRTVRVNSDTLIFDGKNSTYGAIDVPAKTTSMKVSIYDASGALVKSDTVSNPSEGKFELAWDGTNEAGTVQDTGLYTMKIDATVDGKAQSLVTSSYVPVASVTLGTSTADMKLNLLGLGAKKMSDILEIAAG